jgi:hypothetical protein
MLTMLAGFAGNADYNVWLNSIVILDRFSVCICWLPVLDLLDAYARYSGRIWFLFPLLCCLNCLAMLAILACYADMVDEYAEDVGWLPMLSCWQCCLWRLSMLAMLSG